MKRLKKTTLTSSADDPVVGMHCQQFGKCDFYSNTDTLVMVSPQTRSDVLLSLDFHSRKLYVDVLSQQTHLMVFPVCGCIVSHCNEKRYIIE